MATIPRRWSWSSATAKVSRQASFTRSLRRWRRRAAESRGAIASRACRFLPEVGALWLPAVDERGPVRPAGQWPNEDIVPVEDDLVPTTVEACTEQIRLTALV